VVYLGLNGEIQHAVEDLETAARLDPSPPKFFHLAQAYRRANDMVRAKQYLKMAQEKGLPSGLHALELTAYEQLQTDLGSP
jgi:hypothetical protein